MDFVRHYDGTPGFTALVAPPSHGFTRLGFGMLTLAAGETYAGDSGAGEIGLIILTGTCDVRCGDQHYSGLGGRQSVFDGRATAVYVPRDTAFAVAAAAGGVEVAVCSSPAARRRSPRVVRPEDVVVWERGHTGFRRLVHDVIGPRIEADALLVGETYTFAGNWSGYPPHKHDRDAPPEAAQEEIYFFKLRPEHGFGIQCVYSAPGDARGALDLALPVRHDDVSIIPYGYHPVAAPPGYDVYYLWALAGTVRQLAPRDDPAHAWLAAGDPPPRTYPR